MRKLIVLLLLACAGRAYGQDSTSGTFPMVLGYDLSSAGFIYCRFNQPVSGLAEGPGNPQFQLVTTAGALSATVASVSASTTDPFSALGVGDLVDFFVPGVPGGTVAGSITGGQTRRYLTAKASADSVTVNQTMTIGAGGATFAWWKQACGTAATDGWVDVTGNVSTTFIIEIDTIAAASIDYDVECRGAGPGSSPVFAVASTNKTAVGAFAHTISATEPTGGTFSECRVGLKINVDAGVNAIDVRRAWRKTI